MLSARKPCFQVKSRAARRTSLLATKRGKPRQYWAPRSSEAISQLTAIAALYDSARLGLLIVTNLDEDHLKKLSTASKSESKAVYAESAVSSGKRRERSFGGLPQ